MNWHYSVSVRTWNTFARIIRILIFDSWETKNFVFRAFFRLFSTYISNKFSSIIRQIAGQNQFSFDNFLHSSFSIIGCERWLNQIINISKEREREREKKATYSARQHIEHQCTKWPPRKKIGKRIFFWFHSSSFQQTNRRLYHGHYAWESPVPCTRLYHRKYSFVRPHKSILCKDRNLSVSHGLKIEFWRKANVKVHESIPWASRRIFSGLRSENLHIETNPSSITINLTSKIYFKSNKFNVKWARQTYK